MKKLYILSILFLGLGFESFSQVVEVEACKNPPKKVLKLIQKAGEEKEGSKINQAYLDAITEGTEYASPYYAYGKYAFEDAMRLYERGTAAAEASAEKSIFKSEGMLLKAIGLCDQFHANAFYYLGVINYYQKENTEALTYFKKFQQYENKDINRYDKDHDQKLKDVADIVIELEEEAAIYSNPVPFKPAIVENVSSPVDDLLPMISPDNELMFYTRRIPKKGPNDQQSKIVEEFTYSHRTSMDEKFDKGMPFNSPFNDGYFDSYGAATMAVDNKEMIFCACKDITTFGQTYRNCDLYITRFERSGKGGNDYTWTKFENLGPGINDPNCWEAQPTLSADGSTLIYTKSGPNTQDNDLFVSYRDEQGKWSTAVPIAELNSPGKDKSPFLHQDSETLYFVSSSTDTRKGVGGTDIFYSRKEGDKWGRPKNIGYPINTKEDEIGIFVSTNGKLAYYSSRSGGSDWNIYAFELYKEARPHAVAIVKGDLKDNNGHPINGATIEISYGASGKTEKVKVNGHDGKYAAIVKVEDPQDVAITVKKEGNSFDTKLIAKKEMEAIKAFVKQEPIQHTAARNTSKSDSMVSKNHVDYLHSKAALAHHGSSHHGGIEKPSEVTNTSSKSIEENSIVDGQGFAINQEPSSDNSVLDGKPASSMVIRNVSMEVQPLKEGMAYTINNILFATNSFVLNDASKTILKQFSKFLSENKGIEILIQGHTDDVGDAEKNKSLSQERANAVKNFLIELGIAGERLESKGYGSSLPKVSNTSDENKAINRRTDFLIKKIR